MTPRLKKEVGLKIVGAAMFLIEAQRNEASIGNEQFRDKTSSDFESKHENRDS